MVEVRPLAQYTPEVAARLGVLMTYLSTNATGAPVDRDWLEFVIASPSHELLLAYDGNQIVGMATISVVAVASFAGKNIYLEDLVTDANLQGKGIGTAIWNAIVAYGRAQGARRIEFTSSTSGSSTGYDSPIKAARRENAKNFYLHQGAFIRDTNFFRFELDQN